MTQDIMTPDLTYLALSVEANFQKFFKGYLELLQKKFKQIEIQGNHYSYYSCGQVHDSRNPDWKPFKHLWDYCEQTRYDFFTVRDLIFERIGYKVVCECQLLGDYKERRRMELRRAFGVDFGEPGNRNVDIV